MSLVGLILCNLLGGLVLVFQFVRIIGRLISTRLRDNKQRSAVSLKKFKKQSSSKLKTSIYFVSINRYHNNCDYGSHSTEYSHLDGGSNQLADSTSNSNIYKPTGGYSTKDWETNDNYKDSSNGSHSINVKICVYLMTNIALHMDVENGANVTVQDLVQAIYNDDQLRIPRTASNIFTLWMSSGLLDRVYSHLHKLFDPRDVSELQLKPHHKPITIRSKWTALLNKYAHASESRQRRDEPVMSFQRNIYFPKSQEERIKDERVLDLLYAEAKSNVIEGRYPCEHTAHYIMLGSIQARIELGPYNPQVHTLHFFRDNLSRFLPTHLRSNNSWGSWLRLSSKDSPEVRLLEHYKRLPDRKLQRKYLEFCWALPYYGSAFFQGQIEQPVRGLTSLITHQDIPVLVGINAQGVYVINNIQCVLLLGLKYDELSWDFAKPSQEDNPDCLPCLFLQFRVVENGTRVSKILQIFSKQAVMMDALITGFVEDYKQKMSSSNEPERTSVFESNNDGSDMQFNGNASIRQDTQPAYLCNKLSKLTLATFDEEGRCIGQMGSWSFSY